MIPQDVHDLHEAGWSIIPVGPDKRPLLQWKPFQEERASIEQIEAWERDLDPAVWGGVTGRISKRFTLDFDGEDGKRSLRRLGPDPHRITPSGGYHVDFEMPSTRVSTVNGKTKRNLAELYPGVDVRGDGGYANLHGKTTSGPYRWVSDVAPREPGVLPGDLRQLLGLDPRPDLLPRLPLAVRPTERQPSDEPSEACVRLIRMALDRAGEGRNAAGFWLATQLRDHRVPDGDARIAMGVFTQYVPLTNPRGEDAPYTVAEALASLAQAYSVLPRRPFLPISPAIIVAGRQLSEITHDAVEALTQSNDPPWLFVRGGKLAAEPLSTVHISALPLQPDRVRLPEPTATMACFGPAITNSFGWNAPPPWTAALPSR